MLTKRMLNGGALVLGMSAALRLARGQVLGRPHMQTTTRPRDAYFAGLRARGEERRRHFIVGIEAARARLRVRADDPEALLWLAANLGAEALERGKLSALRVLPEMERLLLSLEARAPEYDHAAAARTLARLYHKAPPFISIGSSRRAREFWERALARAGDHPANQVLAADFFADVGETERARDLARRYLQHPISASEHPEAPDWQRIAERIAGRTP
jgi:hypothetical protein